MEGMEGMKKAETMLKFVVRSRAAILFLFVFLIPGFSFAGGIEFGMPFYTLDLTETIGEEVPDAIREILGTEIDQSDIDAIVDIYEGLIHDLEDAPAGSLLANFPVPLIGGAIEFPMPMPIIDGLRISGGFLNDQLGKSILANSGIEFPLYLSFGMGEGTEQLFIDATIDPAFSTFMLSTELVKRLDLLIAGIEIGLGVDLIRGGLAPGIDVNAYYGGDQVMIELPHPDGFTWSGFTAHGLLGLEIGPPFLRLFAQGRFLIPMAQSSGWWGINLGNLAGGIGLAIRF
jgi:hypothetical protein